MTVKNKLAYEAPALKEIGSFEQITQSTAVGRDFDSNFFDANVIPVDGQGHPLIAS